MSRIKDKLSEDAKGESFPFGEEMLPADFYKFLSAAATAQADGVFKIKLDSKDIKRVKSKTDILCGKSND